jgi:CBS domain containing-hemolysin-like protein
MTFSDPLGWALFCLCLGVSFLLSGFEAGLFALSRLRVRQQMSAGRPAARLLHGYLEDPENFLWTILVGNTLANLFILGWLAVRICGALASRPVVALLAFLGAAFLFYTFFDLLPKTLFRLYPNRLCLFSARPFRVIHWVLRPVVAVVESVSRVLLRWRGGQSFTGRLFGNREEMRLLMQETSHAFSSEEQAMINRVLDFQSLTVRQAMLPLSQAVAILADSPVAEALALCRQRGLTRLPVWELRDGVRRIAGLLNLNRLLYEPPPEERRVRDFVTPALFLDEDLRLELAMRRMQRSGHRLAIVLGRDRREAGIISLQDILRAIFGEVSL